MIAAMIDLFRRIADFLQSKPDIVQLALAIGFVLVLILIFKLARSSSVEENGKVVVRYYPPTQWPKRYHTFLNKQRAEYSPRQNKFLHWMYKGKAWTEALAGLLLGLILMAAGVFLLIYAAELRRDALPWLFVGAGAFFIAMSLWVYRSGSSDNPFSNRNTSDDE